MLSTFLKLILKIVCFLCENCFIFVTMKLRLSIIFSAIILLLSCRGDEDEIQIIDQVLNLYMKNSAGEDLLNTNLDNAYSVTFLELLNE